MTRTLRSFIGTLLAVAAMDAALAQMRPPPAFAGGIPGMAQFRAISMQRHQARTLLYREALEELRKNPAAADVPECPQGSELSGSLCLRRPEAADAAPAAPPDTPLAAPQAAAPATATVPAPPAATAPAAVAGAGKSAAQSIAAMPSGDVPKPGRRYAVLFGNNDYAAPIPQLETPIADVSQTADVLKSRFGYETRVVKDATKAQIIESLNQVAAQANPEDSVLLFYAGHGYLMDDIKMGFWIPIDASVKTAANWISNKDISKLLAAIRARQLILVSDSCFSGSLTHEQKITSYGGTPKADEVLRRRSVVVLSSGGDEPVSDEGKEGHSIFAYNLIKALDSASGTTPGYEIWRTVHRNVKEEYAQEPQYGAVVSAGHAEGGEYLFQPR